MHLFQSYWTSPSYVSCKSWINTTFGISYLSKWPSLKIIYGIQFGWIMMSPTYQNCHQRGLERKQTYCISWLIVLLAKSSKTSNIPFPNFEIFKLKLRISTVSWNASGPSLKSCCIETGIFLESHQSWRNFASRFGSAVFLGLKNFIRIWMNLIVKPKFWVSKSTIEISALERPWTIFWESVARPEFMRTRSLYRGNTV